ncbi:hypothetical protein N7475_004686 [Penicillium sp. IBT 31633x]|nr:hypothetical protein N7475_004686 [Penicillium sp. IBT 31633x]
MYLNILLILSTLTALGANAADHTTSSNFHIPHGIASNQYQISTPGPSSTPVPTLGKMRATPTAFAFQTPDFSTPVLKASASSTWLA